MVRDARWVGVFAGAVRLAFCKKEEVAKEDLEAFDSGEDR
jgi:hypothetical protein